MARIEYLIQHPNEVEYTDLELLNTEIEKYPYFYSLRALKLLALKKGNDSNYEQELKVTSVYSPNRKELYNFIHQAENSILEQEIIEDSELIVNDSAAELVVENNIIEEKASDALEDNSVIEIESVSTEEPWIEDELTKDAIAEITSDSLDDNSIIEIESVSTDEPLINETIEETSKKTENLVEVDNEEIKSTETLDEINTTEELPITEEIENSFETEVVEEIQVDDSESDKDSIVHDFQPTEVEESETNETGELIIDQPTIESIIEEIKLQDYSTPEVDTTLIDFDLPSVEEKMNLDQSIENSLEVAKQFIVEDKEPINHEIIDHSELKIEEIPVVEEPKIEQVSLINRASNISEESVKEEIKKSVSTLNPFQIQNIKNEVVGGFNLKDEEVTENTIDVSLPNQEIIEVNSEQTTEIEAIAKSVKNFDNKISEPIIEKKDVREEINSIEKPRIISKDDAHSFNDWLKLPQYQSESTPERDVKYQIIDEFLEKNPKITPIKKQEIPESKNHIKDVKQTDFSDLMTETLAQIYIEQKQFEKAIKAYKILSLKYPEKNSLFAKQIKEIEILKNSK